jgi:hypothetical protein
MTYYQISMIDDNTKMVAEAEHYEIAGGWVTFLSGDEQVLSVPQCRILSIANIPAPVKQDPLRITIEPPVLVADAEEVAKVTKRIIKDYAAGWGSL